MTHVTWHVAETGQCRPIRDKKGLTMTNHRSWKRQFTILWTWRGVRSGRSVVNFRRFSDIDCHIASYSIIQIRLRLLQSYIFVNISEEMTRWNLGSLTLLLYGSWAINYCTGGYIPPPPIKTYLRTILTQFFCIGRGGGPKYHRKIF